jgi:hypothetical protein
VQTDNAVGRRHEIAGRGEEEDFEDGTVGSKPYGTDSSGGKKSNFNK